MDSYLATRDTDRRLEILESAPRDFLDRLECVASQVDEEGLLLARAFLSGHESEEFSEWCDEGCEECKESEGVGEGDRNFALLVTRIEECSATVWSCLSSLRPRMTRLVVDSILRKARDAGPPGTPIVRVREDFNNEKQFADFVLAAHETMRMDEDMLDAMTSYAISLKFIANPCEILAALARDQENSAASIAYCEERRAVDNRAEDESFRQPAFCVAPDWEKRIQTAQGGYSQRLIPNPGAGPCLVGIDFDTLDSLIGPP